MSIIVRTPEGRLRLYCKGAVSTGIHYYVMNFKMSLLCMCCYHWWLTALDWKVRLKAVKPTEMPPEFY